MPIAVFQRNVNPFAILDAENLNATLDFLDNAGFFVDKTKSVTALYNLSPEEAYKIINQYLNNPEFRAAIGRFIDEEELKDIIFKAKFSLPNSHIDPAEPSRNLLRSKSCWYSLKEISDFIDKNKMIAAGTKYIEPGIRFYFGLVPSKEDDGMGGEKPCRRLTTALVPTSQYKDAQGNIILDPQGDPVNRDTVAYVSIAGEAYDHGDLCPPKCNGANYQ